MQRRTKRKNKRNIQGKQTRRKNEPKEIQEDVKQALPKAPTKDKGRDKRKGSLQRLAPAGLRGVPH